MALEKIALLPSSPAPVCKKFRSAARAISATDFVEPFQKTKIAETQLREHKTAQSNCPLLANSPRMKLCGFVSPKICGTVQPRASRYETICLVNCEKADGFKRVILSSAICHLSYAFARNENAKTVIIKINANNFILPLRR